MGLNRVWIRLLQRLFPGVFHSHIDSRGFDMVAIDATLDLHRVAELKPNMPDSMDARDYTVKAKIENAVSASTRFLNGGNPEYDGPKEQAYYWADKTLVVCTDNPVFVPRAKNSTQVHRGNGQPSDGVITPAVFRSLFSEQIDADGDLCDIYNRTLELFAEPPTIDTNAFWRSSGFRWIIINEFAKGLEKTHLAPTQLMVVDPHTDIRPDKAEWNYRINRIDLRVSDTENMAYAKLGALGRSVMSKYAAVRAFSCGKKHAKLPFSPIGEGEQKVIAYIDRDDAVHMSYLIVCGDNDVIYSLLMRMPSLINAETGRIEKEIWVDLSQQNRHTMTPGTNDPTRFVNVVDLWVKLMTHFHKHAPLVKNPIETFSFLACCTGCDFNDAMEPTVRGLKTSEKIYWDTYSSIVAPVSSSYISSSGDRPTFAVESMSKNIISQLVTSIRCLHHPGRCEHEITINSTAFEIFYTACCSKSIETTQRSLQTQINKFKKLPAPKRPKKVDQQTSFTSTIRTLEQLIEVVEQLKTEAAFLEELVATNASDLSVSAVTTARNLVKRVRSIAISKSRCDAKRNNLQWTLNYMRRGSTGMDVSVDTPLNIYNLALRKSAARSRETLPPPPANYQSILRQSKTWPWIVKAVSAPSSHDYNNSYHQVECVNDETDALSNRFDFYSVETNQVLL